MANHDGIILHLILTIAVYLIEEDWETFLGLFSSIKQVPFFDFFSGQSYFEFYFDIIRTLSK